MAVTLLPLAELTTVAQLVPGALFDVQLAPAFVEKKMAPKFVTTVTFTVDMTVLAAATRFEPLAETAMEFQDLSGTALEFHEAPELVEV